MKEGPMTQSPHEKLVEDVAKAMAKDDGFEWDGPYVDREWWIGKAHIAGAVFHSRLSEVTPTPPCPGARPDAAPSAAVGDKIDERAAEMTGETR
jgi:hypothetical protein